jgi:SAM-dependent methyltransferase
MIKKIIKSLQWRTRLFKIKMSAKHLDVPCTICGGHKFVKGPNDRLSFQTGKLPWCLSCWALERHRGLRVFWESFDKDYLKDKSVLQFSHDPATKKEWFKDFTITIYSGENSLDVQNIDKPDGTYDIVLCNQVIEHVPDDEAAIKELLRITSKDGFVEIGVPYPSERDDTIDWGKPNAEDHDHYRNYGRIDLGKQFDRLIGEGNWKEITVTDPITGTYDYVFMLCHSKEALESILSKTK